MHNRLPQDQPIAKDHLGDPLPEAVARLGANRFRHEGGAESLAFTPDGKALVGLTNSVVLICNTEEAKASLERLARRVSKVP